MERGRQLKLNASELVFRVQSFISQSSTGLADDGVFNELALALFAFQFESVPIYRDFCRARKAPPETVKHWNEIPALPVSAFKEHVVSSLPENERARVFHSSGTTGQIPSRHFHNGRSLALYETSLLAWFGRHFPEDGSLFLFLTPSPAGAPHSSLAHMFETVGNKLGSKDSLFLGFVQSDGSWTVDTAKAEIELHKAAGVGRKISLFGTAFSFVHLLDYLEAKKSPIRLPAGSRVMETGGYKGRSRVVEKSELRRMIARNLGVPDNSIVTEYGMSELSSQAYDKIAGAAGTRSYQFPPWARAQIISPETGRAAAAGEPGLLRVFDLANVWSVTTIQTEDLAVETGSGFDLLGRAAPAEARGCSLMAEV